MNVITPLPLDEPVFRSPRPKIVYVKELDAFIQENLIPEILRLVDDEVAKDEKGEVV